MGQLALGFRSLLIRSAVFFVMAVLLAWALGGTLWPKAEIAAFEPVAFGGREWFWQLAVGGRNPGEVRWTLMVRRPGEDAVPADGRTWAWVARIVPAGDALYFGGLAVGETSGPWSIERLGAAGEAASFPMPDRLAVELQLARLEAGLDLQDKATILRQRARVLEPEDGP